MWPRELGLIQGRDMRWLIPRFGRKPELPPELREVRSPLLERFEPSFYRDKITSFYSLITGFCCHTRYGGFANTEIDWPGHLRPARNFKVEILSPNNFRKQLREVLRLEGSNLDIYFGFRWVHPKIEPVVTESKSSALLYVAGEEAKRAVVLKAQWSNCGEKLWPAVTVCSPGEPQSYYDLQVPLRSLEPLLLDTAELAVRCAEFELGKAA